MYNGIPTRVLTNEVRLSYVHLVTAWKNNNNTNAEPRFSATLLIPKTDTATYDNIMQSAEAAAQDALTYKWNGVRPQKLSVPIHDGDGTRENGTPFGKECHGCWVITASSKQRPGVVHISDIHSELAPQDIYSGMYARVTINFFGYFNSGKKGVGCGLGNVLKTRDGDPLSGGATAYEDFASLVPSANAGQPANVGTMGGASFVPTGYPQNPQAMQPQYMQPQQFAQPMGAQPQYNPLTGQPIGTQINPLTGLPM